MATVFWSTVDPNSLNLFVEAALLFDHVFTVDEASIERYRGRGHPSVAVLPFAAQPWTHNPILFDGARKRRVGFADSALGDMHASREQTEIILEPAIPMGLEIVSLSQSDPKHRFPASLAGSVVESLSYDDVVVADKLYKVAVALSPAGPSSTICPRRIFELLASGATVLTERSAAIERLVGSGMVFESASAEETKTLLRFLLRNDELRDRTAVRAVRKVIRDHTYGHRLDTILRTLGLPTEARRPTVSIICSTNRSAALPTMLANVARQTYGPLELVVVLHGEGFDEADVSAQADAAGLEEVTIRTCDAERPLGACLNMGCEAAAGQILAKMDDDNYYAPEYLADLVDAFEYSDAGIVGKAAHYTYLSARGMMILRFPKREHRYTTLVQGGTLTMLREVWRELRFEDLAQGEDTTLLRAADAHGVRCYSADRFNYVSVRGADPSQHAWQIDDEELMFSGIVQAFAGRYSDVVV